jgi:excisionase family DNA binding protein
MQDVAGAVERGVVLLTATELASQWRVPRARVYELAKAGAIPSVRLGRQLRFPERALEQFIARQADSHAP